MFPKAEASLSLLPVEILHHIFNELDGTTLFLTVRNVCQSLRAAVKSHHQYALDFTSVSKPDFRRLLRLIRPECVTGLSFSDEQTMTPGQIDLFLSLVNIDLFTRLRSLSLPNIDGQDIRLLLDHVNKCPLTTLMLHKTSSINISEKRVIARRLASIIAQPSFLHLELSLGEDQSSLIEEVKWPVPCKLRYLRISWGMTIALPKIIAGLPELETLVLEHERPYFLSSSHLNGEDFLSTSSSRLTSLTLSHCCLEMDEVQSVLSQTPSLRHVKVVISPIYMTDGSRWEQLIKSKLHFLNKFEFYTRFNQLRFPKETEKSILNEMIASSSTPFWTEEKRWMITCNVFPTFGEVEIYTSPICISLHNHTADPKTMTMSNFEKKDQDSTVLEAVNDLRVNLPSKLSFASVSKANRSTELHPYHLLKTSSKQIKMSKEN
jgi:hypothetical protein